MTARDVLDRWTPPREGRGRAAFEFGLNAKEKELCRRSWNRWLELPNKLVIRRMNIRRANRKMRRQSGMDLKFA
jgi:hypothetical protein